MYISRKQTQYHQQEVKKEVAKLQLKRLAVWGSIILLMVVLAFAVKDKLLEAWIEKTGESIIGARVEVVNLTLDLLNRSVVLEHLRVADPDNPWQNLFETGRVSFSFKLSSLLRGKFLIDHLSVHRLRFATARTIDGQLPDKHWQSSAWVNEARQSFLKHTPHWTAPIWDADFSVDSLLKKTDLQSLHRLEHVRLQADSTYQRWLKTISEFEATHAKSLRTTQSAKKAARNALAPQSGKTDSTSDSLSRAIVAKTQQAGADFDQLTRKLSQVGRWVQDDLDTLKRRVDLNDFDPQEVMQLLFGPPIVASLIKTLRFVDLTRKYLPVSQQLLPDNQDTESTQTHAANGRERLPDFLIRDLQISEAATQKHTRQAVDVQGTIQDISNQPGLYGKPLNFELQARFPNPKT
ncbi:MAG: hypothetical protein ACE5G1_17965, partial [bacterium]